VLRSSRDDREQARGRKKGQQAAALQSKENSLKLTERSGNVYENKGSLWKTRERSGNVYENTGSYPLKVGMLLKRKAVKASRICAESTRQLVQ
jgi:hypothetical protein